ncbi:unnamed protein product [Pedinophyceae sp. YPF-701]|nr:unnamed protein product [Pedinophyceae sp. YPF-701]
MIASSLSHAACVAPCGRRSGSAAPAAARPLRVSARPAGRSRPVSASPSSSAIPRHSKAARGAPLRAGLEDEVLDTVVVGAGVSGLCTAQALKTRHGSTCGKFLVTEGRERVGGNITTVSDDQFVWEEGPNSFQPNDSMLQIAVDAGIEKDLVFGDPKAPRFVFWEGRLRPTPSGPDALTFDLMSFPGKIRAGLGAIGLKAPAPAGEESVEQFIRRNLGDEVFYRLIEPFCSGVYAGDPSKLSMKAAFGKIHVLEEKGGSLVGGALKLMQERKENPPPPRDPRLPPKPKGQTVGSFRDGLKMLPEAIAKNLEGQIRLQWQLQGIEKTPEGLYKLSYSTPEGDKVLTSRSVALTVPSYVAADLLAAAAPAAKDALASFDYPPVAAVTIAYPLSAIKEDRKDESGKVPGFGQLHPRTQGIVTLGTIYSSSLFPGRAPEEYQLLLCYIGGATNRGIKDQSEDEVVAQIDKDLRKMLVKDDAPAPVKVGYRCWPRAIPQFNLGHMDQLAQARAGLSQAGWDGVLLGGNYVSGVALGKCVEFSYGEFADSVAAAAAKAPAEKPVAA